MKRKLKTKQNKKRFLTVSTHTRVCVYIIIYIFIYLFFICKAVLSVRHVPLLSLTHR